MSARHNGNDVEIPGKRRAESQEKLSSRSRKIWQYRDRKRIADSCFRFLLAHIWLVVVPGSRILFQQSFNIASLSYFGKWEVGAADFLYAYRES